MFKSEYKKIIPYSPYKPMKAEIMEIKQYTEMEKLIRLRLKDKEKKELNHVPGQFVEVSIFGFVEAPISVCSSPTDKGYFELTVRKVGNLTTFLHNLKAGDIVGIRGPFGKGFPIDYFFGNDVLIIAGGLGIVPLRSLIRYIMHQRKDFGEVQVLLGSKSPKDILFADETGSWSRHIDIRFEHTVDKAEPDWKGNIGLITSLIPGVTLNPMRTYVVVVGPPVMYKFVIKELLKKGIPDKQIILSLERRMRCGMGKCGHCQINGLYTCKDGPVFSYKDIKNLEEAI